MLRINIVFSQMRAPRFEIPLPRSDANIVWTVKEEAGADVVVYCNGYSYDRHAIALNPEAFRILYIFEPLVVYPRHFLKSFWRPFDIVMTWSESLLEQGGKFIRFPSLYYDFPFGAVHGIASDPKVPADWKEKRKAICQVAGNKYSFIASELYSRRRKIARWFGRHGSLTLDTYGTPPMPVPGYKGVADDKQEALSKYRFALCLENEAHPIWSRGYVTEKIFDCFYAFTVPIYLGAADIEQHVPPECFIDLRAFASLDELDRFLDSMSDEKYLGYLKAIEAFLNRYDAPRTHSCYTFYDRVIELAKEGCSSARGKMTEIGFWQTSSLYEKIRGTIMLAAVPIYRKLHGSRYAGT